MTEEWRPIEGWPYEVSDCGQTRRVGSLKPLKARTDTWGYPSVTLWCAPRSHHFRVHTLVARAFLGSKPSLAHIVNHLNGRKNDNRAANLEWVTNLENMRHASRIGRLRRGENHVRAVLTEEDVRTIRKRHAEGVMLVSLAREYGVWPTTIGNAVHRVTWAHLP